MTPIESFKFLFNRAYFWINRQNPWKLREGTAGKPGELVEKMSAEEREALKGLTSDQISEGKVSKGEVQLAADSTFYSNKEYYDRITKEAKLKFDKQIVKEDPRANRKKY